MEQNQEGQFNYIANDLKSETRDGQGGGAQALISKLDAEGGLVALLLAMTIGGEVWSSG